MNEKSEAFRVQARQASKEEAKPVNEKSKAFRVQARRASKEEAKHLLMIQEERKL
ncbi:MAG: hypothetical protein MRZ59_08845 [Clostridiales bacterium]|nr:hypothetical protein [Clostridiales bacterium]MDY3747178.1 hypothetical protein [Lachnospiraceae bacterium]